MDRFDGHSEGHRGFSDHQRLSALLREAQADRRRWVSDIDVEFDDDGPAARRERAADVLEALLSRPPGRRDVDAWLGRVATALHLSSARIHTASTSFAAGRLPPRLAKSFAVVLADVVHFCDATGPADEPIDLWIALGREDGRLLLAVAVEGGLDPVGGLTATDALLRAGRIAAAAGGSFSRGVDAGRMIFGAAMPIVTALGDRDGAEDRP